MSLGNQISSQHGGLNSTLLDGRRLLETIRVDTTKKLFGNLHTVKGFDGFVPVGIKVGIGQASDVFALGATLIWWLFAIINYTIKDREIVLEPHSSVNRNVIF